MPVRPGGNRERFSYRYRPVNCRTRPIYLATRRSYGENRMCVFCTRAMIILLSMDVVVVVALLPSGSRHRAASSFKRHLVAACREILHVMTPAFHMHQVMPSTRLGPSYS